MDLQLTKEASSMRLSEAVYETVLEAILGGQLAAGQSISELELARQLDVSRTPVHEAMGQLIKDGLVQQKPNRRPVIASFTARDVADIFDMRRLLETEAASRAADRLDRLTLQRLQSDCARLREAVDQPDFIQQWTVHDNQLHSAIAQASGSPRLCDDIMRYRRLHDCMNRLFNTVEGLIQAIEEHLAILRGLSSRNPEAAAQAMSTHIQEWKAFYVRNALTDEQA